MHLARPGDQSAQPRRGAGALGRHLPGRRRRRRARSGALGRRHPARQSGLRDRQGGVAGRPARRLRRRQLRVASFTRQDGQFRQINQDPTYRTTSGLAARQPTGGSTGSCPLARSRRAADGHLCPGQRGRPQLLTGTDLRGEALPGLRKPESLERDLRLRHPAEPAREELVHPQACWTRSRSTRRYTQGSATTEFSEAQSSNSLHVALDLPAPDAPARLPAAVRRAGRRPARLHAGERDRARPCAGATVSLVPSEPALQQHASPRLRPTATASRCPSPGPTTARSSRRWRSPICGATRPGFTWQPLGMLNLNGDLTSTRDLRVYPDSTLARPPGLQRAALPARHSGRGGAGPDLDHARSQLTPGSPPGSGPGSSRAAASCSPARLTSRDPVRDDGDSGAFILPQTLNNAAEPGDRRLASICPGGLRRPGGDSSGMGRALGAGAPVRREHAGCSRTSTYDLAAFDPGLGYHAGARRAGELPGAGRRPTRSGSRRPAPDHDSPRGADLPLGFSGIALLRAHPDRPLPAGEREPVLTETVDQQREWPVGNVRWTHAFRGGPLISAAAGTAFRHREGSSVQARPGEPRCRAPSTPIR